jgi:transposase
MTIATDPDLASLKRQLVELAEKLVALERENKILREENAILKQGRFGRSSERLDPGQLGLFAAEPAGMPPTDEKVNVPAHERYKRGHGRAPFADHVPRATIECDVPAEERSCSTCGKEMRAIGEDVSERGHIIPARIVVNRYVRKKYACPAGHGVVTAAAPPGVIEGAKYEASVFAYVATAKYSDHLPLNRLEGIFKRQGVHLPKQTMWDMLVRLDELVAQPVLRQMRKELLEESVLHADETPVTMCLEDAKGSRKGYAWCWRNLLESKDSKSLVEFRVSRERDGPTQFLGDWSGTLIIDGYSGYNEVAARNGIVRAGCWAHARRKLKKALDVGTRAAAEVMAPVQRLFWIERAILRRAQRDEIEGDALLELRARVRAKRSRRVVETIHAVATDLRGRRAILPKSKLGKALGYLDNQRDTLSVFLDDPRIPIHNNDCERDIRHIAVGRKNWLVFASQRGGEVACRLYSIVLSCRQAGIDPQAYFEDVLLKVSTTPATQIASLTPWAWALAHPTTPAKA